MRPPQQHTIYVRATACPAVRACGPPNILIFTFDLHVCIWNDLCRLHLLTRGPVHAGTSGRQPNQLQLQCRNAGTESRPEDAGVVLGNDCTISSAVMLLKPTHIGLASELHDQLRRLPHFLLHWKNSDGLRPQTIRLHCADQQLSTGNN